MCKVACQAMQCLRKMNSPSSVVLANFVTSQVDSSTPTAARAFVDRHVRPEGSGLREAVLARLTTFTTEYYAK